MIKEAIGTGDTIEEAKENALILLGADITSEIDFEVMETPKKKTFGLFGGSLAKVRAFYEAPDPVEPKKTPAPAKKPASKPAAKAAPKAAAKPTAKSAQKSASAPTAPAAPKSAPITPEADSSAGRAANYLKNVFEKMDVKNVTLEVREIEGGHEIDLSGDNLGVVIGRRGETLDALQYLASLAANCGDGYSRIVLNTGDYREKRISTLQGLARRVAAQVARTGRSRSLEAMNPYERRIIHTEIQQIDGVVSNSTGDGANRRVVIIPEGGARQQGNRPQSGRPQGQGGRPPQRDNRSRQGFRDGGRSSAPITSAAPRAPRKDIEDTSVLFKDTREMAPATPKAEPRVPKSDVDGGTLYGKVGSNNED